MEALKKIACFVAICIYILCVVGASGNLFFIGEPLFAIATLVVAAFAFPTIKKMANYLLNESVD